MYRLRRNIHPFISRIKKRIIFQIIVVNMSMNYPPMKLLRDVTGVMRILGKKELYPGVSVQ